MLWQVIEMCSCSKRVERVKWASHEFCIQSTIDVNQNECSSPHTNPFKDQQTKQCELTEHKGVSFNLNNAIVISYAIEIDKKTQ